MRVVRPFMRLMRLMWCFVVLLLVSPTVRAQEGYPLTGTWYGDWGTDAQRHDVTVILDWDGRQASGLVNPGPDQLQIKSVVMDVTPAIPAPEGEPSTSGTLPEFHVRFEVEAPNAAGGMDAFVFEGEIFSAIAGNRSIRGRWTCGGESGTFQIRRL